MPVRTPNSTSRAAAAPPASAPPPADTRARLVQAMSRALQQRGYHGIGLAELLADADAPKGVLYHHFPGGKQALAIAAIEATAGHIHRSLDQFIATRAEPLAVLKGWIQLARQQLEASDFERGCPLATVALESTADDQPLRDALAAAFEGIRERLARLLAAGGVPLVRAAALATLAVAAYEGALIQARVARSGAAMDAVADALLSMLQQELHPDRTHPAPPGSPP